MKDTDGREEGVRSMEDLYEVQSLYHGWKKSLGRMRLNRVSLDVEWWCSSCIVTSELCRIQFLGTV